MPDISAHRIRLIIDHLIDEGFLLVEEGEYPVVTLGRAEGLLKEEESILMKLPREREKVPDEKKPKQKDAKLFDNQNETGEKLTGAQNVPVDIDENLLGKLKKLRKKIASKESVPAYIVFSDASLRDMCRKKPVSLVQFLGVNGVGNVKLDKYGELFTKLIREYC